MRSKKRSPRDMFISDVLFIVGNIETLTLQQKQYDPMELLDEKLADLREMNYDEKE